jgi:hypothetical protein
MKQETNEKNISIELFEKRAEESLTKPLISRHYKKHLA